MSTSETDDTTTNYTYEDETDRQHLTYITAKLSVEYVYENGNLIKNGEGDLAKKIEVQRSGLSEKEVNVVNYEYDSLDRLIHSSEERIEDVKTTEVQRSEHIYDGNKTKRSKQQWKLRRMQLRH